MVASLGATAMAMGGRKRLQLDDIRAALGRVLPSG
jgi:hypothetical protein